MLLDLFDTADVHTVVVRNGVVLHAPGELNLGRSTRLANRAQRRALRATYASCAIPGCATRFDLCKIHHVHWWRHGGNTDLHNLLPICVKHHTLLHTASWQLHLPPDPNPIDGRLPKISAQPPGPRATGGSRAARFAARGARWRAVAAALAGLAAPSLAAGACSRQACICVVWA